MATPRNSESRREPATARSRARHAAAALGALLAVVVASGAQAFPAPGVTCDHDPRRPDVCRIDLADGLAIEAGRSALFLHEDGRGYDVYGTVEIPTGQEPLVLAASEMRFRTVGRRSELQYASALLPF
ncbi:MAG TPA: hypothetical protein PLW10_14865, partial [Myxococcota bacterium]|nr:hypothetical protein [Myxococcota bacterium]